MPSDQIPTHETPRYYRAILERVRERAGLDGADEARAVLDATLNALGSCLAGTEALALSDQMPADLANVLGTSRFAGACDDEDEIYRRVERSEDVGPGFAREHVQAVCQVLREVLMPEVCQRLARALPAPLADLLTTPPATAPEAPPSHEHTHETPQAPAGTGHTLADGRPGSRHPLSEGKPGSDHPVSESD